MICEVSVPAIKDFNFMKFYGHVLKIVLLCIPAFSVLVSCEKQRLSKPAAARQAKSVEVTTYDHKGLKIVHPVDWIFMNDQSGVIADRLVSFETEEVSRITVYFYKNYPRSFSEQVDALARELRLDSSEHVKGYHRSAIKIGGYEGFKLAWTSSLLVETTTEITILQIRSEPFPVFVHFHLFDEDIELQNTKIIPFFEGISFDPQGIEL